MPARISAADKFRMLLSPLYLIAGVTMVARGWREPLGWLLGLAFAAFGVYRLLLVRKALRDRRAERSEARCSERAVPARMPGR